MTFSRHRRGIYLYVSSGPNDVRFQPHAADLSSYSVARRAVTLVKISRPDVHRFGQLSQRVRHVARSLARGT
jgi:hypothetical protein